MKLAEWFLEFYEEVDLPLWKFVAHQHHGNMADLRHTAREIHDARV